MSLGRCVTHVFFSSVLMLCVPGAQAQAPDLSTATIEELMKIRVTTVAKKEQSLTKVAAAVYVITQDEIRRSGAESLPDVLRLAPGVEVAQINSNSWAITIRGFNSQFANKLLVLIDGRTVYSPTYSGVFWNEQDLALEDVERIEVIRGPGATMWGMNAVNGVINIITRSSPDTQGVLAVAGGGTYEHVSTYARYGGKAGKSGTYRISVKHVNHADLPTAGGGTADDGWTSTRGGFRSDWRFGVRDSLTVQGDGSSGGPNDFTPFARASAPFPGSTSFLAGNLLARWQHTARSGSAWQLQLYYDHARESYPAVIDLRHDSLDIDMQHNLTFAQRHEVVWGGTFRNVRQRTWGSPSTELIPAARTLRTFSAFLQDDISCRRGSVHLIAGAKLESNPFTGVEIQPTVRILFAPSSRQALWAAASRAMRSRSESESTVRSLVPAVSTPFGTMNILTLGNPHGRSEELISYEAGYRVQATRHLSLDMAAFYGRYHHLSTIALADAPPPDPATIPVTLAYTGTGTSYGYEVSGTYAPVQWWKLTGSYSWLHLAQPANLLVASWAASLDPEHQFQFHSLLSLRRDVEIDSHLYFTGALEAVRVPRYTRADIRLAWRPNHRLEWSVTGRNLLDSAHPEFVTGTSAVATAARRSVYGKLTWRF